MDFQCIRVGLPHRPKISRGKLPRHCITSPISHEKGVAGKRVSLESYNHAVRRTDPSILLKNDIILYSVCNPMLFYKRFGYPKSIGDCYFGITGTLHFSAEKLAQSFTHNNYI